MDMPRFVRTHRRRKEGQKKGDCHPRPASSSDLIRHSSFSLSLYIYIYTQIERTKGDPSWLQRGDFENGARKANTNTTNIETNAIHSVFFFLFAGLANDNAIHHPSPSRAIDDCSSGTRRPKHYSKMRLLFRNCQSALVEFCTRCVIYIYIYIYAPMSGLMAYFQSSFCFGLISFPLCMTGTKNVCSTKMTVIAAVVIRLLSVRNTEPISSSLTAAAAAAISSSCYPVDSRRNKERRAQEQRKSRFLELLR